MTWWTLGWIVWGLIWAGLETTAIIARRGGTLSELVWRIAGSRTKRWTWRRVLLLAAMVWLTVHFVWG